MSLLIKNGTIVTDNQSFIDDIVISDSKIEAIGKFDIDKFDKVIDATGKYIFPGGIDPHVHMNLPSQAGFSSDDFNSGTKAALAGGTTTIIDFVTPQRGESMITAYEKRLLEAKNANCDFTFHMSPVEWTSETAKEIRYCYETFGITSFKTYLAYKNAVGIDDDVLKKVMEVVYEFDGIVTVHCELGDDIDVLKSKLINEGKTSPKYHPLSRPNEMESKAVQKVIELSIETGCKVYIVHVSASESVELIRKAKSQGVKIYAETCPHYLLLDDSCYEGTFNETAKFVLSPPIRKKKNQEALWQGISDGTIDTIGTDHAPFNLIGQKDVGKTDFTKIPNGAGSIEYRLALLYTYGVLGKIISIEKFIALTSSNAANIFGLNNSKGFIKEGYDADLLIWDSEKEFAISTKNQFQNCDSNIYEGYKLKGWPSHVIQNGEIIFEDNQSINEMVKGKYINR
jgi:dihydropyrimidinase